MRAQNFPAKPGSRYTTSGRPPETRPSAALKARTACAVCHFIAALHWNAPRVDVSRLNAAFERATHP